MTRKAVQKPISSSQRRKRKAVQNPKTSRKRKGVETPKSEKLAMKQILSNDDLPEDIVVQILVHVPMKQVFMFRCVSKRWNAILASPFFRQSYKATRGGGGGDAWTLFYNCADVLNLFHEEKFIPPSIKQFISNRKPPLYSSCGFPFENHCKIISSGHGLLLCRLSDPTVYAICDPITSRWELLPLHKVPYHEPRYKQNAIQLEAFVTKVEDPTRSSGSISFKVIRVLPTQELNREIFGEELNREIYGEELKMEIYDSMTEKWEQVETHWVPRSTISKFQRPVCLNGIVHWIFNLRYILAYNHTDNQCRTLDFPSGDARFSVSNALLDACNGKLHYAEIYGGDNGNLVLWVLDDYDCGTFKLLHTVRWGDINSSFNQFEYYPADQYFNYHFIPLAFNPLDPNILYLLVRLPWWRHKKNKYYFVRNETEYALVSYDSKKSKVLNLNVTTFSDTVTPYIMPLWPPILKRHTRRPRKTLQTTNT